MYRRCPRITTITEYNISTAPRGSSNKPGQTICKSETKENAKPSRKRVFIILTPVNPIFGIYRHIHCFSDFAKNIDCGYSFEPPHRGGSNEHPKSLFWAAIRNYQSYLSENFQFLDVKFSIYIYLNRRVFVMNKTQVTNQRKCKAASSLFHSKVITTLDRNH